MTKNSVTEKLVSDAETMRRKALTDGLRALADFLDAHPSVPMPPYNTLNVFVNTRDEIAQAAKAGGWDKVYSGDWFFLNKSFGEDLMLAVCTNRETVCRKVVVGKRTIPAQPEQEIEEIEWVCEEKSLLAEGRF